MASDLYDDARREVSERQLGLVDEDELQDILASIAERASADLEGVLTPIAERVGTNLAGVLDEGVELRESEGDELLTTIEAWASLASAVTYEAYVGPPREVGAARFTLPGWAKAVGEKLTDLAKLLGHYLEVAMRALRATSFSISLSFPWGVSVGLSWG